jgi:hypothetical protein
MTLIQRHNCLQCNHGLRRKHPALIVHTSMRLNRSLRHSIKEFKSHKSLCLVIVRTANFISIGVHLLRFDPSPFAAQAFQKFESLTDHGRTKFIRT